MNIYASTGVTHKRNVDILIYPVKDHIGMKRLRIRPSSVVSSYMGLIFKFAHSRCCDTFTGTGVQCILTH